MRTPPISVTRCISIIILTAAIALTTAAPALPEVEPMMMEVRYAGHKSYAGFTRLVFDTDSAGPSGFKINLDEAGRRVVFYPVDGLLALTFAPVPSVDGLVRGVDFVQEGYAKRGIVIKLGQEAGGVRASRLTSPDTLVLDIYAKSGPKPFLPYGRTVRTVAIDPGHGGAAVKPDGTGGMAEGDLTLDIALRVRKLLTDAGYRVVLTRDKDVAVTPDVRAGIANAARADVFVSIHAGGSFGPAREQAAVLTMDAGELGTKAAPSSWPDQNAPYLLDSIDLAAAVSGSLSKLYGERPEVRQTRLAGVQGLAMPAVVVEAGSLGGSTEGGALAEDAFHDKFARHLAIGISSYARGGE
ncbi:MAG: N-acetylmuramoyl-L-alanine amidase [Nitrospirae bacterium]|nr:N-acetylmuramoyl-L-alanine amidase [Nitrospirota bacterium]